MEELTVVSWTRIEGTPLYDVVLEDVKGDHYAAVLDLTRKEVVQHSKPLELEGSSR